MSKTIKIGDTSYRILNNYAGFIRSKYGKPISLDSALLRLLKKVRKSNVMDFAGSWKLTDKETNEIELALREMWKKWRVS